MKKEAKLPLKCGGIYHIYNQGNNQENLFKETRNYFYFLRKYKEFIQPIAETYAYCLLPNHFHILLKIKDYKDLSEALPSKFPHTIYDLEIECESNKTLQDFDKIVSLKLSKQFASFFGGYTRAINNAYARKGKLFSLPFKRIEVTNKDYLRKLVCYIHRNPIHHFFCKNYTDWPFTSYQQIIDRNQNVIKLSLILELFDSLADFLDAHLISQRQLLEPELNKHLHRNPIR